MDEPLPDSLCPIYKEELAKMLDSLEAAETDEQKIEILIKFSDKYLMPPKYWEILIELHGDSTGELYKKGEYHFYSLEDWQKGPCFFIKEIHIKWDYISPLAMNICSGYPKTYMKIIYDLKNLIKFPHHNLEEIFGYLKWHGPSPITKEIKQTYEKSLKLYKKFEEAGDDDEKWLKCMEELVNGSFEDKAVIDNIELRLGEGRHYANKKIWKFYINFMKSKNSADLLFIYNRYCRLFISDSQARRQFLILKYAKFPFVCIDFVKICVNGLVKVWKKENQKILSPKMYFNDCKKAVNQTMPFHDLLMQYITESAKAPILHKLHKTCKYFFHQRPYPVCHRLIVGGSTYNDVPALSFIEQSLFITCKDFDPSKLQNLYISDVLCISNDFINAYLSSKFYKCEAKTVNIKSTNLDFKNFIFLVKSGAVEDMDIHNSKMFNENGQPMEKEEVKKLVESYGNKVRRFIML